MMFEMLSFLFYTTVLSTSSLNIGNSEVHAYETSAKSAAAPKNTIAQVPFYSQFADITSPTWQKVGCGVTSLAMVIDYYKAGSISVNKVLSQGIALGAYNSASGWSHQGLIDVSKKYGLNGSTYDYSSSSKSAALEKLKASIAEGPVIASVHYKLEPTNPIPHLIVVTGIKNGYVYYNDPAAKTGEKKIAIADFQKAWKQRYIVVRPSKATSVA